MSDEIKIDPEFKSLIPALSGEEYKQLEENILRDGCKEALTIWRETDILLDGHNRKEICEQHGLTYRETHISLPDRDKAKDWIIKRQLGRRNLSLERASELRAKMYQARKQQKSGRPKKGRTHATISGDAAEQVAKETGVHRSTVLRDAKKLKDKEEGNAAKETTTRQPESLRDLALSLQQQLQNNNTESWPKTWRKLVSLLSKDTSKHGRSWQAALDLTHAVLKTPAKKMKHQEREDGEVLG